MMGDRIKPGAAKERVRSREEPAKAATGSAVDLTEQGTIEQHPDGPAQTAGASEPKV